MESIFSQIFTRRNRNNSKRQDGVAKESLPPKLKPIIVGKEEKERGTDKEEPKGNFSRKILVSELCKAEFRSSRRSSGPSPHKTVSKSASYCSAKRHHPDETEFPLSTCRDGDKYFWGQKDGFREYCKDRVSFKRCSSKWRPPKCKMEIKADGNHSGLCSSRREVVGDLEFDVDKNENSFGYRLRKRGRGDTEPSLFKIKTFDPRERGVGDNNGGGNDDKGGSRSGGGGSSNKHRRGGRRRWWWWWWQK